MLPPGSFEPDAGPSDVIFPPQQITLRFNHAKHLAKDIGTTCKTCHAGAYKSTVGAATALVPTGEHVRRVPRRPTTTTSTHVKAGDDAMGQCAFCHVGYKAGDGNVVAALELPRANLLFNHKAHVDRNIGCAQCHGAVEQLELATRDQLPRMRGCFNCHQMPDSASRGRGEERVRHVPLPRRRSGDAHQDDVRQRHARARRAGCTTPSTRRTSSSGTRCVAADDSQFCANCHKEDFCTDCHDGRVRPRSIHPSDYLNMHPIEARMETQKCQSCHREQSFCLDCHLRVGRRRESSPPNAQGQRALPPAEEHLERPAAQARAPRVRGRAQPERSA